jgi:hypothetical protein
MTKHSIEWYKPKRVIRVNDKMQKSYEYTLQEPAGKNFDEKFKPALSPKQMLVLGVFEGKYLNDCENEFPKEWYIDAKAHNKLSYDVANPLINLFCIKSRLSLQEWEKRKWIPIVPGDKDVRGWFQWYCRYWIGRRDPNVDYKQIARWRSFVRHQGQIIASLKKMSPSDRPKTKLEIKKHRPKQRQALLQWAYDPFIV